MGSSWLKDPGHHQAGDSHVSTSFDQNGLDSVLHGSFSHIEAMQKLWVFQINLTASDGLLILVIMHPL